ncbi:MAG TPA: hypothetical protein VNG31_09815 [Candidatus Baltobacteraceae bacterium]|nr:hypothetical protein [Candidatus Baltobacteraceae bacterium]
MSDIPTWRRVALAAIALAVSGWLLRGQIADGLVVRGDEMLYRGAVSAALTYYRRAMLLDPGDGAAVDRFAFFAMNTHDGAKLRESVAIASRYLQDHPGDDVVRMDRAMAYRSLADNRDALPDFARIGKRAGDARALTFAGYCALALGQRHRAVGLLRDAVALAPSLPAARDALMRLELRR